MTTFGKVVISTFFVLLLVGGAYVYYKYFFLKPDTLNVATSFEECIAQGNPAMESYPRQCIDEMGNHFTEVIATSTDATTTEPVLVEKDYSDMIQVTSPLKNATITSPVKITGKARGGWYFEASFPITIVDWDGRIIGEGYAEAKSDWMTSEFVPFEATVNFTNATDTYSHRGAIILKNDNPSGLPENDKAIELPVVLQ